MLGNLSIKEMWSVMLKILFLLGICTILQKPAVQSLQLLQSSLLYTSFGNGSFEYFDRSRRSSKDVLEPHSNQEFATFMKLHENCSRNSWYCFPQCRTRRNASTVRCSQPSPGTECFGINITYLYVPPEPYILSLLPRYEVLSRFPRCWSFLAPLICAVTFRPCTVRYGMQSYNPNVEKLELLQLFRWDMCDVAMKECSFLLDWGLWPDFLNCSSGLSVNGKDKLKLYANKSCPIGYREDPANFDRLQCLWPLVKSDEVYRDTKPVIDDCYMPCFSSLVSSISTRTDFKVKVLISSTTVGFILLVISVYVIGFSEVWRRNICAYILGHASLSGFLYYLFWILGFFNEVSESAMCFDNGNIRRGIDDTLGKVIGWCGIQSFLMESMFFASYFWLCAFFVVSIGRPRIRADHKILIDGRPDWSLRCILLVLYLIAAIVALPPFWSSKSENDGLLGVCYIGVVVDRDRSWIFFPIVLATIIAALVTMLVMRAQKSKNNEESDNTDKREPVATSFVSSCFKRSSNSEPAETEMVATCRKRIGVAEESGDEAFSTGQVNGTAENEELIPDVCATAAFSRHGVVNESYDNGATAVPPMFLGSVVLVYILSVVVLMLVHFRSGWNYEFEDKMILNSFRCTLNQTILNGETEWFKDMKQQELSVSVDPMVRKRLIGSRNLNAPGCDLKPQLDERFYTLFLLYIIVPSLPFLAVFILLVSGFCGAGFEGIERIREHLNPFVRIMSSTTCAVDETKDGSKGELIEMERLDEYPSSNSSAKWCNGEALIKRPFSSADCLDNSCAISAAGSIQSQNNSEPVKLNKSKHVRKLDLKRLAQCRARNAKKNSSIQSTGGSSCSEQLGMLSSQHCSFASLPSEIPSIYSHVSSNCPGSYNIESVSQQRESNGNGPTIHLQNQSMLNESLWQQMCHEYSGKVNTLVGCLRQAEEEIRRLTGQQQISDSHTLQTAPTSTAYRQVGQNICILHPNCVAANQCHKHCEQCPMFNVVQSDVGLCNTELPIPTPNNLLENCCRCSSAVCSAVPLNICTSPVNASGTSIDESSNPSGKHVALKSKSSRSKGRDNVDEKSSEKSGDSNSFYSDEEDEEEEKLWKEQSSNMLRSEQPGTSGCSTVGTAETQDNNQISETSSSISPTKKCSDCQGRNGNNESSDRRIQHYLLPSLKPPTRPTDVVASSQQSLRSAKISDEDSSNSTNASASSASVISPQKGAIVSAQVVSSPQQQSVERRQLFGNSVPLATVAGRSSNSLVNLQSLHSNVANPSGVRPVLLTEEQARGLLNLRDQLTGNDLLYYSNRLREEAMRRLAAQAPNGQLRIRRIPQNSNRQAEPIREEEEEVQDPFSSSERPNASASLPIEAKSSNTQAEDNGGSDSEGSNEDS